MSFIQCHVMIEVPRYASCEASRERGRCVCEWERVCVLFIVCHTFSRCLGSCLSSTHWSRSTDNGVIIWYCHRLATTSLQQNKIHNIIIAAWRIHINDMLLVHIIPTIFSSNQGSNYTLAAHSVPSVYMLYSCPNITCAYFLMVFLIHIRFECLDFSLHCLQLVH